MRDGRENLMGRKVISADALLRGENSGASSAEKKCLVMLGTSVLQWLH